MEKTLSVKIKKARPKITGYHILKWFSYLCAAAVVAALAGVILFVLIRGIAHVNLGFIFGEYDPKKPTIAPALAGTMMLVFLTLVIAGPIGILCAIFLSEYAKKGKLVNVIRVAVETLAAIPSIVYGLFGYIVFVLLLKVGQSLLIGGLTLSVMVLPTIIRTVEEALSAVPASYREGSLALGAGKVRTVFRVVLPNAAGGIVSALILAVGRVVSESAVLILTVGMVNKMPLGFGSQGTSLALAVYDFSGNPYAPEASAAASVALIFLVVALNLIATGLGRLLRKNKPEKKRRRKPLNIEGLPQGSGSAAPRRDR
jgi:phosphate transport system permease protein